MALKKAVMDYDCFNKALDEDINYDKIVVLHPIAN